MTVANLFAKHKAGEVSKEKFLYEVRRDAQLPYISNLTSYDDAIKILKQKGVIKEAGIQKDIDGTPLHASIAQMMGPNDPLAKKHVDDWTEDDHKRFWHIANMVKTTGKAPGPLSGQSRFPVDESALNEQADLYHQIDRLNPILVKKAVNMELAKLPMINAEIYQKTTEKVVKKLQKDPRAYDEVLVSNAKEIYKAEEKLKMQQVKGENLKDKANEMKSPKGVEKKPKANTKASKKENKKGKPAGVKLMEAIKDILKKKLTEDVHHEYGVGQSIDVPEGHGTIKGMVGDTVTLEFEDGSQKDYQINALNHFKEEAKKPKEEEMTPEVKKHEPTMDEKKDEVIKRVMELLSKKKKMKEMLSSQDVQDYKTGKKPGVPNVKAGSPDERIAKSAGITYSSYKSA